MAAVTQVRILVSALIFFFIIFFLFVFIVTVEKKIIYRSSFVLKESFYTKGRFGEKFDKCKVRLRRLGKLSVPFTIDHKVLS